MTPATRWCWPPGTLRSWPSCSASAASAGGTGAGTCRRRRLIPSRPRPNAPSRAMRCSRPEPASQPPACLRWPTIRVLPLTCSTRCPGCDRRVGRVRGKRPGEQRTAAAPAGRRAGRGGCGAFVCAMAWCCRMAPSTSVSRHARPDRCQPCRHNGFGYDPLFVADGYAMTNGELEPSAKDAISHRGRAVRAILPVLLTELRRLQLSLRRDEQREDLPRSAESRAHRRCRKE